LDFAGTVAAVRQLRPDTNRLVVLSGSAASDRGLRNAAQQALERLNTGLPIDFIEGLSQRELLEKLAEVDHNAAILILTYDEDHEGNNYSTVELIEQLSAKCPASMYGFYDTLIGHGIVGGCLESAESQGRVAGSMAVRVLHGERPEDIPLAGLDGAQYEFDSRQLKRWRISDANLPQQSRVLYREPTFWEQFGRYVLVGVAAILAQSGIILYLLVNRSRRIRAEVEARDLAGKILTAQEDERRYLAQEMHDDLSQRLAAAAIEAGHLEQKFQAVPKGRDKAGSLKGKLIAICDDVHRLSRQIHSAILDDFGLADALRSEFVHFGDRDGTAAEFRCGDVPADLPRDIALCLYRIAQEALWNAAKYATSDRVVVELNADPEFVHLEVRDFGRGFDPQQISQSQGLGLASVKERARLVNGVISIQSTPGTGVQIAGQVPLPEHDARVAHGCCWLTITGSWLMGYEDCWSPNTNLWALSKMVESWSPRRCSYNRT
jgi:signal transduction histidine kinase